MSDEPIRRSPVESLLAARQPQWMEVGGARFAVQFADVDAERAAATTLGLCDVSGLAKIGVKGPGAEDWLAKQGIDLPTAVYATKRLADGGIIARLAADEFILEGGLRSDTVAAVEERFGSYGQDNVFRVERQEATFLLVGSSAQDVLAQTCGINFREAPPGQLVLTRVADVSCGLLPEVIGASPAYRVWIDCSYAIYLWETLVQICEELGGQVIGAGVLFPELL
jgi:glycine cleavage system aminomethyltransferase T